MANFSEELEKLRASQSKIFEEFRNDSLTWRANSDQNLNDFFLVTMSVIIFLMQGGFAFLEAGSVRSKNTTNILIKNLLDSFVSGISYWLVGYAFAYGVPGNEFIGYGYFAHHNMPDILVSKWIFQYVFAATAATIVSGAVAERCDFTAYLVYSTLITGFIYPVVSHWAWDPNGWLAKGFTYVDGNNTIEIVYSDFAGSGAVHMMGGIAAFCGAAVLGPRIGRFDKETGLPLEIKGHSVPLAALGAFVLLFGFLAFNGSSQGSIANEGDGIAVAIAIKSTIVAGSAGAFTTMIMNRTKWFGDKKWSFLTTLNGCLTGMVSVCAGCNQIETYAAFIMGIAGGFAYMITTWLVIKLKVDDPLDATAVHYGGGIWGVIGVGLFSTDFGILYHWDKRSGLQFAWQLAGLFSIGAWTALTCFTMFLILKKMRVLRVPFDYEYKGLDIPKHGEPAYPLEAYGHGWGERGDTLSSMMTLTVKASTTTLSSKDSRLDMFAHQSMDSPKLRHAHQHADSPDLRHLRKQIQSNGSSHANPQGNPATSLNEFNSYL